jgi:hypothetical protein
MARRAHVLAAAGLLAALRLAAADGGAVAPPAGFRGVRHVQTTVERVHGVRLVPEVRVIGEAA